MSVTEDRPLRFDLAALEEVPGIKAIGRMPAEQSRQASEYLLIIAEGADGRLFRFMCSAVEVQLIGPDADLMLDDLLDGMGFFTIQEIRDRRRKKPLSNGTLPPHVLVEPGAVEMPAYGGLTWDAAHRAKLTGIAETSVVRGQTSRKRDGWFWRMWDRILGYASNRYRVVFPAKKKPAALEQPPQAAQLEGPEGQGTAEDPWIGATAVEAIELPAVMEGSNDQETSQASVQG